MNKRRIALIALLSAFLVTILVVILTFNNNETVAQQKQMIDEGEECEYIVIVEGKEECWTVDEEEPRDIVPDYKGLSSTELAIIIKTNKLYPEATILRDKITNIEGVDLREVVKSTNSGTLIYDGNDTNPRKWLEREDLSVLSLYHGISPDGEDILAVSITNISHSRFYIENLSLSGFTHTGIPVVDTLVIHSYPSNLQSEADSPKPQITEPVPLEPNDTLSFYIKGKWILKGIDEQAVRFYAHASFNYESISKYYSEYGWIINTTDYYITSP